jgi:hypothetical protein
MDRECVVCESKLTGRQTTYCSNKCKMVIKNESKLGRMCKHCYKPMKPVPVMGGFKQECERKRCINQRSK